jgi:N-methylhydantoinase A
MATEAAAVYRIGADIGGTFTDVALERGRDVFSAKVLTDHASPERGVIEAVCKVTAAAGVRMAEIGTFIHGTTLATNALIERRGARTAFVTTQGFRDVLEMRTESRFEQYDLDIELPPPLIERADRHVVRERLDCKGNVLIAPRQEELYALAHRLAAGGYRSIAIGFLHSYANGAHERMVRELLQSEVPEASISISCEVSPQMRELERFNSVCANAYVKPLIGSYLARLESALRDLGLACPTYIMHSGGGIISIQTAATFPIRLVESGPAGGALFAADLARRHELDRVLSFDMGGTTAKICLIENQLPKSATKFEVARSYRFRKGSGMAISIPVIEMVEIGAGGGSIAKVDQLRQIRVGPRSAGSSPGPACYGLGGSEPTVTDADLALGRIDPHDFAGGEMTLMPQVAANALQEAIGGPLAIDAIAAAYGVSELVDENMANAGRVHAIENGTDISDYTMITFGGAGPLHAARLCEKLGIARFIVPPGAGVGSAIGFLRAPFAFEAVRTAPLRLDCFDGEAANAIIDALRGEAEQFVAERHDEALTLDLTAFMRYAGQGWEIPVVMEMRRYSADDAPAIADAYESQYSRHFRRPIEGLPVEIVSWSLRASTPLPPTKRCAPIAQTRKPPQFGCRQVFDTVQRRFIEARVYARDVLTSGDCIYGPAIVVERETATVLPTGYRAIVAQDGCLDVSHLQGGGTVNG